MSDAPINYEAILFNGLKEAISVGLSSHGLNGGGPYLSAGQVSDAFRHTLFSIAGVLERVDKMRTEAIAEDKGPVISRLREEARLRWLAYQSFGGAPLSEHDYTKLLPKKHAALDKLALSRYVFHLTGWMMTFRETQNQSADFSNDYRYASIGDCGAVASLKNFHDAVKELAGGNTAQSFSFIPLESVDVVKKENLPWTTIEAQRRSSAMYQKELDPSVVLRLVTTDTFSNVVETPVSLNITQHGGGEQHELYLGASTVRHNTLENAGGYSTPFNMTSELTVKKELRKWAQRFATPAVDPKDEQWTPEFFLRELMTLLDGENYSAYRESMSDPRIGLRSEYNRSDNSLYFNVRVNADAGGATIRTIRTNVIVLVLGGALHFTTSECRNFFTQYFNAGFASGEKVLGSGWLDYKFNCENVQVFPDAPSWKSYEYLTTVGAAGEWANLEKEYAPMAHHNRNTTYHGKHSLELNASGLRRIFEALAEQYKNGNLPYNNA